MYDERPIYYSGQPLCHARHHHLHPVTRVSRTTTIHLRLFLRVPISSPSLLHLLFLSFSSAFSPSPRYRKIAGDVCQGGVSSSLSPYSTMCPHSPTSSKSCVPSSSQHETSLSTQSTLICRVTKFHFFFTYHRFHPSFLIPNSSSFVSHPSSIIHYWPSSSHSK